MTEVISRVDDTPKIATIIYFIGQKGEEDSSTLPPTNALEVEAVNSQDCEFGHGFKIYGSKYVQIQPHTPRLTTVDRKMSATSRERLGHKGP